MTEQQAKITLVFIWYPVKTAPPLVQKSVHARGCCGRHTLGKLATQETIEVIRPIDGPNHR